MNRDPYHSLKRISERLKNDKPLSPASAALLEEIVREAMRRAQQQRDQP